MGARAFKSLDDGSGPCPRIFAAGLFNRADADGVKHISAWEPCDFVGTTFCFGDGSLSTPCPCAPPNGSADAGCTNSHHLSGAKLTALGTTNPDQVRLRGTTLNTYGFTVLLSGTGVITEGVAYGSGVRCVDGSFVRFGSQFAAWGAVAYPNAALGFDRPLSQVSGVTPGLGQTRFYQALYRDTGVNSCAPPWVNLSNAVEITW